MSARSFRSPVGRLALLLLALGPVAMLCQSAGAQVDNVVIVVDAANAVGGISPSANIATFSYDPLNNRMFVAGDISTGQDIRVVNNIGGSLTHTRLVTNTPWLQFTRDGDLLRGGGNPVPGSLTLNPVAVGSFPAYSFAIITDRPGQVTTGGVPNPELTRLLYRYNLAADTNADARDEMTSLVTLSQLQAAPGITSTSSSTTTNKRVTFSSDGSTVYFVDSSPGYRGLWSVPTLGGSPQRLVVDTTITAEPVMIRRNNADLIFIEGTTDSGNVGGIDSYNPSTGQRTAYVTGAAMVDFLDISLATDIDIRSFSTDDDGNLYFSNVDSSPDRRGIFKVDTEGNLVKVLSRAERAAAFGGSPNNDVTRLQGRTATFTGPNGSFATTQVLYMERSPLNSVAGAWVFKTGDFDRDNDVDQADRTALLSKLTTYSKLTPILAPVDDSRYDLNGNGSIDWKDVKVLQSFLKFRDGDTNLDLAVNFNDLLALAKNYNGVDKIWREGEFTGDNVVNFNDLLALAKNYNLPPGLTNDQADLVGESFAADWALAQSLVPEPGMISVLGAVLCSVNRRRRVARQSDRKDVVG